MAINKKLIYYNRTLANFKSDANGLNGQTTASGGNVGNIPYASIVFTSDGYIWTHGKEFNCNNTWRGIQNNLTSTSTTDSLSAYQGKILNEKFANYLPLSGGTLTGALTVPSLTVTGASSFSQAINASILGNAATASRLQNARTISLTGSVTGSGSFDGSGNLSITTTTNHNFDGRYIRWGGSAADVTAMTWGTLTTANGYTILSHTSSSDGGDWGMVNKGGQIFMLLDGYYYQREGQYRVIDTSEITSYGNRNNSPNKIVTTDSNGYIQAGWINTTSGVTTSTIDRIYASNDGYIRYVTPATFRTQVIEPYYVNLTGTQTISGNKTFSSSVSIDDLTTGNLVVTGGASFAQTINGNAATASKLLTARTITIGSKSNSFDGSGNISFTLAQIGALAAGSYKTVQTAVATIGASTNTLTFINSISQDTNGVITATTGVVRDASASVVGVVNLTTQSFAGEKTFTDGVKISAGKKLYFPNDGTYTHFYSGGTSEHFSIGYGRIQGYSNIFINADTDGSTTEHILLTAGHGVSATTSDGLKIGYDSLTWKDNNIYHAGNLSIGTLMGSTAIGDSDEPVYWSGSAFVKAGAYPTKSSWNYDDKYLPLTGANYNTNTDANPFKISRNGGNDEVLAISVNDSRTLFKYTNDEYSNLIVFELVNTDTENSNGSRASDRNVTISSSNSGISMTIGGNTVWHAGNLTTSAAASGGTTASLVTTGDKYKWNLVYDWLTTTTADTDTTINKWHELETFLTSITESDTLTGLLALYLPLSGGTLTGSLEISTGTDNNNYNEGLRITCANNNWAGITLGSTGRSGAPTNGWFIARNPDKLLILSPDTSSNTTGLTLNKGGDAKWRNNTIYHTGNLSPLTTSNYSSYAVPLSGGTMTGALTTPGLTVTGASSFSLAINGSILGNAATASRLLNARTISFTGAFTGSYSFDGSANISINTSHSHSYLPVAQVSEEQNTNAIWGKTYAESHRQSFVYNTSGREWAYWIGMRSSGVNYGTILRLSHDGLVLYAHKAGGAAGANWSAWKDIITSDNIGNLSVNYATSAGSATSADSATKDGSGNTITDTYLPLTSSTTKALTSTVSGWGWTFLNGSTNSIMYVAHNGGYGMHLRGYTTSAGVYLMQLYNNTAELFSVYANGRVYAAGNVGIGSTSPSYKLHVVGSTYSSSDIIAGGDMRVSGDDFYIGSASGSQCHQQYDSTNKVLKFYFD